MVHCIQHFSRQQEQNTQVLKSVFFKTVPTLLTHKAADTATILLKNTQSEQSFDQLRINIQRVLCELCSISHMGHPYIFNLNSEKVFYYNKIYRTRRQSIAFMQTVDRDRTENAITRLTIQGMPDRCADTFLHNH